MANWSEPTPEQIAHYKEWVRTRPPVVQRIARRFKPWKLYRLLTSNHRVVLHSISEDGTMTVAVLGRFNRCKFERRVFGIKPEELVECALPGPDELLGAELTDEADIQAFVDAKRDQVVRGRRRVDD